MGSNVQKYRECCRTEKTVPIFSKSWWLDAVCGADGWDVVIVERDGKIIASLPFYMQTRAWGKGIVMPPLTQTMGVWMKYPEGQKYANKLGFEKEVMTELIEGLPEFNYFSQNFHYSITNWLPFYWKGFRQTTRYTYLFDDISDPEKVFNGFKSSVKNKIRKAEKIVKLEDGGTVDKFHAINKMTFDRQGLKMPYSFEFLKRLDETLEREQRRNIFFAIDSQNRTHSALYLVWDDITSYVHMVGEDPQLRSSGAGIFLVWEAIKFTRNELGLNNFDFEGSMIEPVEEVRRSFGAKQMPYFNIYRDERSFFVKLLSLMRKKVR